jgi:competence protein ComEA
MDRAPGMLRPPDTSSAVRAGVGSSLASSTVLPPISPPVAVPGLSLPASWPRPAQGAAGILLVLATFLLGANAWGHLRFGACPTELQGDLGLDYRVDLNRAGRAELLQLPGVGPNLAERIESYRKAHGGFRKIEELRQVRGIGPALLERLRPWVYIGSDREEVSEVPARSAPRRPAAAKSKRVLSKREAALKGVRININRASRAELQRLPRIGTILSQRILEERLRRPFASVEELRRVRGIGPKTVDLLRPYVCVTGDPVQIQAAKQAVGRATR